MTDEYIAEMERTMPVPPTSFPWQDMTKPWEWADDVQELLHYMEDKGTKTSVIFTGGGDRYNNDGAKHWKAALAACQFVVLTSPPCEGHILRSRMLNVLEARLPNEDEFHAQVLGRFGEAMHVVAMKERAY